MWRKIPAPKGKKFPSIGKAGKDNSQAKIFTIRRPAGKIDIGYVNDVVPCLRIHCETYNLSYMYATSFTRQKQTTSRIYYYGKAR